MKPAYEYSWKRQNWFDYNAAEHKAIRNHVGLFDMSSFGKIMIMGKDAEAVLQKIACNNVAVEPGKIVYTQFLNGDGGIEADVTITRLDQDRFIIVTPAATIQRDLNWIKRHTPDDAHCSALDVTAMESVLVVMGPEARDFLQPLIPQSLANDDFPFGTMQNVEIGHGMARAHRVSYVGELGWELYVSSDMAVHVYDELMKRGQDHPLALCGLHTLDSCRIEKAFRHFGHDISSEDHILDAGLGFAARINKQSGRFGDFIGRDAVVRRKEDGVKARMMQFRLNDADPLLYHNEPIIRDGEIVSYLTSGNYGHHLGGAIGMGYVPCRDDNDDAAAMLASDYVINVAGADITAQASLKPMYDPDASRMKA